jgi:hypothetical protein
MFTEMPHNKQCRAFTQDDKPKKPKYVYMSDFTLFDHETAPFGNAVHSSSLSVPAATTPIGGKTKDCRPPFDILTK